MNPEVRIFILAGGLGTRLAHITKDVPKPMAPVAGRPFLEWQIEGFRKQGFRDFVFLVGHKKEVIMNHFGDGESFGVRINYSLEDELLGTGGAFLKGLAEFPCEFAFIVNGDTYFDVSLAVLRDATLRFTGSMGLALKYVSNAARYGTVSIAEDGRILAFLEKGGQLDSAYINGGIYACPTSLFQGWSIRKASMETEIFPALVMTQKLYGFIQSGPFIDIGVSDDYHSSQVVIPAWTTTPRVPALFLDRDGVMIEDSGYVKDPASIMFLPEALELARIAKGRGHKIVVVSNQAGVAKGILTVKDVEAVNMRIAEHYRVYGVEIDAFYFCPFHSDGVVPEYTLDSLDRKPKPGMILQAADRFGLDLARSLMIGDKDSDVIQLEELRCRLVPGRYSVDSRFLSSWEDLCSALCE